MGVAMQRVNIGGSKGSTPTIACINRATVDLGVDFASLIAALQKYVGQHAAPVWGTPAKLVRATKPRDNAWTMLFVDTAADVRNLRQDLKKMFGRHAKQVSAFHFFKGRPILLVSHELAETLVDPGNNLWCERSKGTLFAYEVCDAVEADH